MMKAPAEPMSPVQAPREAYRELANYLRQHPEGLSLPADELAERTGLPLDVVSQVLVQARNHRAPAQEAAHKPNRFRGIGEGALSVFLKMTDRPVLFTGISTLTMLALVILTGFLDGAQGNAAPSGYAIIQGLIILSTLVVQMACFYRHARARIALYGALVFWLVLTPALLAPFVLQGPSPTGPPPGLLLTLLIVASISLAALFGGMGVVFAILGGYVQVRRADQQKERLTRQQLLERLFEIEERLRTENHQAARTSILDKPVFRPVRTRPFLWAAILGATLSLIMVLGIGGIQELLGDQRQMRDLAFAVGSLGLGLISYLVQIGLSFAAGRPWRGVAVSLLYTVVGYPAGLIPLGSFGMAYFKETFPWGIVGNLVFAFLIGLMSGLGALIEERAALENRLQRDDPAALLAEMVEIQLKLNPSTSSVCVMVVDAAKSSVMKAEADPLVAEWTFREYQRFLADIVARFGGRVHSTAGDGAVMYFSDPACGFRAAQTIQTEVGDFNTNVSKLKSPFRLRIGLHSGAVAGEIEKVQFTEVIDIAAHVEAASQVGGICVTEPVADLLEGERLAELKDTVDGFKVYLALNPTLGP
ncbi:MAG: hypothetical protein K1X67_15020 [Fimbriimonadaceae bacterium]|nr:hypothetical protein [Fimbriimonadaceae bacterium]